MKYPCLPLRSVPSRRRHLSLSAYDDRNELYPIALRFAGVNDDAGIKELCWPALFLANGTAPFTLFNFSNAASLPFDGITVVFDLIEILLPERFNGALLAAALGAAAAAGLAVRLFAVAAGLGTAVAGFGARVMRDSVSALIAFSKRF